jgi:hypothetical protein
LPRQVNPRSLKSISCKYCRHIWAAECRQAFPGMSARSAAVCTVFSLLVHPMKMRARLASMPQARRDTPEELLNVTSHVMMSVAKVCDRCEKLPAPRPQLKTSLVMNLESASFTRRPDRPAIPRLRSGFRRFQLSWKKSRL